jgi:hypothetical protein
VPALFTGMAPDASFKSICYLKAKARLELKPEHQIFPPLLFRYNFLHFKLTMHFVSKHWGIFTLLFEENIATLCANSCARRGLPSRAASKTSKPALVQIWQLMRNAKASVK